jgi:Neurotransmitter-gated ion-channel ligand binding domain/Neurotransmitter-gated ion-channel transmembrane region
MRSALLCCCLLLAVAAAVGAPSLLADDEAAQTVGPPLASADQSIPISVGVYLLNLVALDEASQTFTCTGYLTETWHDPRLVFSAGPGQPPARYYRKQDIWFPILQFDNSASPRTLSSYLMIGKPDGSVQYVEKFMVRLSSNMQLRAFPFDSQDLEIYVHPFSGQVGRIVLSVDPASTGVSTASYTPLPLWSTGRITYRTVVGSMPGEEASSKVRSHVVFAIHVSRNSEYYTFRIFIPLALMVAVSWGVFWIPADDLNSQLLISVTTVLTLVAFSVALSNILPPVPYLTFYDAFFLICFLFILLSIGEALIAHTVHRNWGHTAVLKIRRRTRLFLPFSFFSIAVLVAIKFLSK